MLLSIQPAIFLWKLNKKVNFSLFSQNNDISLCPQTMHCMGKLELVIESDNVSIYSPKYDGETLTEFEKFMSNNGALSHPQLKKDFDEIIARVQKMLTDCGARENLFRLEGRNIKALPLIIEHRRGRGVGTVRLYCIRISDRLLILGNGGIKKVARFEDDPVLLGIVNQLRDIEPQIFVETRKAHSDYEDYQTIKTIIETITI